MKGSRRADELKTWRVSYSVRVLPLLGGVLVSMSGTKVLQINTKPQISCTEVLKNLLGGVLVYVELQSNYAWCLRHLIAACVCVIACRHSFRSETATGAAEPRQAITIG